MANRRGTKKADAAVPNDAPISDSSKPEDHRRSRANRAKANSGHDADVDEAEESLGAVPEMLRKALEVGLSSFFLTEATIRKAVGDTIPKDWMDFAVDQSDRTRADLLERLSSEVGRSIERIDYAAILERLLEGRTLEINAQIRLGPRREGIGATKFRISLEGEEEVD
jgi:N-acyl-D-aspartate/D-glutamate deacylase